MKNVCPAFQQGYDRGETSQDWGPDMDGLNENLDKVKGSDFEIVKTGNPIVVAAQ